MIDAGVGIETGLINPIIRSGELPKPNFTPLSPELTKHIHEQENNHIKLEPPIDSKKGEMAEVNKLMAQILKQQNPVKPQVASIPEISEVTKSVKKSEFQGGLMERIINYFKTLFRNLFK